VNSTTFQKTNYRMANHNTGVTDLLSRNDDNYGYCNTNALPRAWTLAKFNNFVLHMNIRSFNRNSTELFSMVATLKRRPDVIVLSETWFTYDTVEEIDGYVGYHVYRRDRRGGGISIYVANNRKNKGIERWSRISDHCELCSVDTVMNGEKVKIIGVYRPPDRCVQMFSSDIREILSEIDGKEYTFIVGDLNVDLITPNAQESDFIAMCQTYSFLPMIEIPTHASPNSQPKCLDHIWFNQVTETDSGAFMVDITDHYPIYTLFVTETIDVQRHIREFRDHSCVSLGRLRGEMMIYLNNFSLGDDSNIDERVDSFVSDFLDMYNNCCPIRKKCFSYSRFAKPWINRELINCINRKHDLFRQYKRGEVQFDVYNTFKNRVSSIIRRVKCKFYCNKFDSVRGDVRETWKIVNSIINSKSGSKSIDEIEVEGRSITDSQDIAEEFNSYFRDVAVNLERDIPRNDGSPLMWMGNRIQNSLFAGPSTDSETALIINRLKNRSYGLHSVPTFIYKYLSDLISPIICKLFNLSLTQGIFPASLKVARIKPIHKKGNSKLLGNYRPISTLPLLSKIFEKLMLSRLLSFIKSNNVLGNNQFGFRKNNNTADAILEFLDCVYNSLSNKEALIATFLDFSKAFDTICHDVLLDKLDYMGVRGHVHSWFRSYLYGRSQYVSIGKDISTRTAVQRGVPQGSVLGPILFILYVNDMRNCCNSISLLHFADDTTGFLSSKSVPGLVREMNLDLNRIAEWVRRNRLFLNINKTCYMVISDSSMSDLPSLMIENNLIARVTEAQFLGVTIDDKLSFKQHVEQLCGKLSKTVGMLNRISNLIPPNVKLSIYYSLIFSRVSYGIVSWGSSGLTNAARIQRILSRARKIVTYDCFRREANVMGLLSFDSIYKYFTAIKLFRTMKLSQHPYFSNVFDSLRPIHEYRTRFSSYSSFNTPAFTKAKCQKSFRFQSVKIWNLLPENIKLSETLAEFKCLLRKFLIREQYEL